MLSRKISRPKACADWRMVSNMRRIPALYLARGELGKTTVEIVKLQ